MNWSDDYNFINFYLKYCWFFNFLFPDIRKPFLLSWLWLQQFGKLYMCKRNGDIYLFCSPFLILPEFPNLVNILISIEILSLFTEVQWESVLLVTGPNWKHWFYCQAFEWKVHVHIQLSKLIFPNFLSTSDLKSLRTKTAIFPETLQTEARQITINFREITSTFHV